MKKIIVSVVIVMFLSGCVGPWFAPGGHKGGGHKGGGKDKPRAHKFVE
ncbi:hypothetical protein GCM10008107_05640 [Psychrosphaera saromensis]|nr:hypothetical protein [Psychrosphaera saromensis]GHB59364.1 hypothetical protein GCM10008107_05640 [Psychrosphaera saromensis]GLQ14285.1 hypothetical protein GCM10007917_17400 [Psychrosphaera saromensis]